MNLKKFKPKTKKRAKALTWLLGIILFFTGLVLGLYCYALLLHPHPNMNGGTAFLSIIGMFISVSFMVIGAYAPVLFWGRPLCLLDKFYQEE